MELTRAYVSTIVIREKSEIQTHTVNPERLRQLGHTDVSLKTYGKDTSGSFPFSSDAGYMVTYSRIPVLATTVAATSQQLITIIQFKTLSYKNQQNTAMILMLWRYPNTNR
jgi:hypothetical protein